MEIMISVLITFYNQRDYVEENLKSVLNQKTNFNYEVLCGDDGSSDGTYEVLKKWEKFNEKIHVFRMDRNLNDNYEPIVRASRNRYNLLKNAKGKYITILDGDDFYTSNDKLQFQFNILEKYNNISCCCHSMSYYYGNDIPSKPLGKYFDTPKIIKSKIYWKKMWIPAEAFLFRNFYDKQNDNINPKFFDDNLITFYSLIKGNILYIPDDMASYRQNENSSWNSRNEIQKAFLILSMYEETKRISKKMRFQSFIKCAPAFRTIYKFRNEPFYFPKGESFDIMNKMYLDSSKYRDNSILKKLIYHIKYFIPGYFVFFVKMFCIFDKYKIKSLNLRGENE